MKALFNFTVLQFLLVTAVLSQTTWMHVLSPNPSPTRSMLRGISATSENDIWAVGNYETTPPGGNYAQKNLVIHWTGDTWTVITVPEPPGTTNYENLWDVSAISPENVWAVGDYAASTSGSLSQVLHYDGNNWSQTDLNLSVSSHYLWAIDAISDSDIWAVGGQPGDNVSPCLAIHYNGSSWTEIPVPPVGERRNRFMSIDGIASGDVWAVGTWGHLLGHFNFLAMHWDGNNWTSYPMPASLTGNIGQLTEVHMIATDDVWAIGDLTSGGMALIHWDGNYWSEIMPSGGGGAIAGRNSNDVYAVGEVISHWDGQSWQVEDSISYLPFPGLIASVVLPSGEIWAAGITVDENNVFETLVMRSGAPLVAMNDKTSDEFIINAYPNPAIENLRLNIKSPYSEDMSLKILNVRGKVVYEKNNLISMGSSQLDIQEMHLEPGIYFLEFMTSHYHRTLKIIKK